MTGTELELHSLADRPDLLDPGWEVDGGWPAFMLEDPVAAPRYVPAMHLYPDLHLVGLLDDRPVARVHAVPIAWHGADTLPDRGWDWALGEAVDHPRQDRAAVSLIEIRVDPSVRGRGLSHRLVEVVRRRLARAGTLDLVGPVRPTHKAREPRTPMEEYARRTRPDGLPDDPWLRVHVQAGGRIVRVAPLSMVIPGTLDQWRAWTGDPFDRDGLVEVPGALTPVLVDTAAGHAVYVEPNVWVHHDLRG